MKYSSEMDLLTVASLSLIGLLFLWLFIPVPVWLFNYLPLFLISYLLVIILPGYAFLTFIKPGLGLKLRLGWGVILSLLLLFGITFLFIDLQIVDASTYAASVLLILTVILSFMTYLGEKMADKKEPEKIPPSKRKPLPPEPVVDEPEKVEPVEKIKLTPHQDAEIIIPDHRPPEGSKKKVVASPEKPALKLPWIERQKELDQEKKKS